MLRAVAADEAAATVGPGPEPQPERPRRPRPTSRGRRSSTEHRDAFVVLTDEITRLADDQPHLISAGLRAAHETLLSASANRATTYTADGAVATADPLRSRLVDRSL